MNIYRYLNPLPLCRFCTQKYVRQASQAANQPWTIHSIPEDMRSKIFRTEPLGKEWAKSLDKCIRSAALEVIDVDGESSGVKFEPKARDFPKIYLPDLNGSSILEHFEKIGTELVQPVEKLIESALKRDVGKVAPKEWSSEVGWTCYDANGIPYSKGPDAEKLLIFDVEVNVATSQYFPIMATAYAPLNASWYSWNSAALWVDGFAFNPDEAFDHLIPVTSDPDAPLRVVVGHNVGFDRQYIQDEYRHADSFCRPCSRDRSRFLRFVDTMAMHQAVAGLTQLQMNIVASKSTQTNQQSAKESYLTRTDMAGSTDDSMTYFDRWLWANKSSKANLVDVHRLHCGGFPLHMGQKSELRNVFVTGTIGNIRDHFQSLMQYCADDVWATFQLFKKLYPKYRKHNPHPVTFAGSLIMGNSRLPADSLWKTYKATCNKASDELSSKLEQSLRDLAASVAFDCSPEKKNNVWLRQLDWALVDLTRRKDAEVLVDICGKRSEVPRWYFDLIDRKTKRVSLTLRMHLTPLLAQMRYRSFPLYHTRSSGWCFLVASRSNEKLADFAACDSKNFSKEDSVAYKKVKLNKEELQLLQLNEGDVTCYKLPHASGKKNQNVGTPFTHDYMELVASGVLTSDTQQHTVKSFMQTEKDTRFWTSNKSRVCKEQLHIRTAHSTETDASLASGEFDVNRGWVLPKLCVHGTLTRRATESTWLVATNAQTVCVGGELKSMLRAPKGFKFVGADVDAEEIWIAALIGDASGNIKDRECRLQIKGHGVTPLGWMVVAGDKNSKTDVHSFTARQLNLKRDEAKVVNYGRIYGAGLSFLKQYLEQNAEMDSKTAAKEARKLLTRTKGKEVTVLSETASNLLRVVLVQNEASICAELAKLLNKLCNGSRFNESLICFALYSETVQSHRQKFLRQLFQADLSLKKLELTSYQFYLFVELVSSIARLCDVTINLWAARNILAERKKYFGGTESCMFSKLEEIATQDKPRTPFLGSLITQALQPENCGSAELPSRINWVVQSSAVDFLHLLLVAVEWLKRQYNVPMMFSLSIHDEVRYLVRDDQIQEACWVLQVAHLWTRCFFSAALGIHDLPASVAYFSSIDVDSVLRKEPSAPCVTVSNPLGLEKGHGVKPGMSVTADDLIHLFQEDCNTSAGWNLEN